MSETEQSAPKRKYSANRSDWGAITKMRSGRFQAAYRVDGVRYTAPHTFDAKTDARAFLRRTAVEVQNGTWVSPAQAKELAEAERMRAEAAKKRAEAERFDRYAETWLTQRVNSKGEHLRPTTRREYARQIAGGLATFSADQIGDITTPRVRAWHADRMKIGKTQAAREAALLKAIMATAVQDGVIDRNPVEGKLTRSKSGIAHRPPTADEMAILIDSMPERLKLALLLAGYAGLRLSEWRALRRSDFQIDGERVTVRVTRQAVYVNGSGWHVGDPKSAEGIRSVALPSWLTETVKEHLAEHVGAFPDSLVFAPSGRTEFLTDKEFTRSWDVAREAAGVRVKDDETEAWTNLVREHDLRHFHLSQYAMSGATLAELKARAGHSTAAAALIYQHALGGRDADLADALPTLPTAPKRLARISGERD
ncbi:MAG: site-specific integrase [Nocardiaceae bacterium]|nr:site-specific integrase [Nocardiaceae bacterium]